MPRVEFLMNLGHYKVFPLEAELGDLRPGVIADFGYDGHIVQFEILDASKIVTQPQAVAYEYRLLEKTGK